MSKNQTNKKTLTSLHNTSQTNKIPISFHYDYISNNSNTIQDDLTFLQQITIYDFIKLST